ncbi:MAG: molybdenum cofactor biosynthesis protein MoaE [Dermatophilaceae bacterium]
MTDPVRLCAIRGDALSADEVLAALADPACGGQVLFLGRVRDHDHAREVLGLGYSAHTDAEEAMRAVCRTVAARHHVPALAAVHRVGDLAIGDLAVIVGVAAPHRGEAFAAARDLIDTLKSSVPIWKHQTYADGTDSWVGLP